MERRAIVVYGATGFTGRLVCRELAARGASFAIAGRDAGKLAALAGELRPLVDAGSPASSDREDPEIVVAAIDDAASLRRMAAGARVVLDCAGPFATLGRPVQDAALAAGSHFLDVSGELSWMRASLERDAEARAAGVVLVTGVGFDVVPTDAAAALAAGGLEGAPEVVRIAFATKGGGISQGTARSALGVTGGGGLAWIDGAWKTEPIGAVRWRVPFPEPVGPRDAVSVPWGDVVTAPRSTGARNVRCFMALSRSMRRFLPLAPLAPLALRIPGAERLARWWIARRPEGPSAAERARSAFTVYAEARSATGRRSAWVTGGNVYDFTGVAAVECAMRAAAEDFRAVGALSPSLAFGGRALLEALAARGACRYGEAEG